MIKLDPTANPRAANNRAALIHPTDGPWHLRHHDIYGPTHPRSRHRDGRILIGGVVDRTAAWRGAPIDASDDFRTFEIETMANAGLITACPALLLACRQARDLGRPPETKAEAHTDVALHLINLAAYTPGPWLVSSSYWIYSAVDSRSRHPDGRLLIAGVVDDTIDWRTEPHETPPTAWGEAHANAQLFGAAPDLLTAYLATLGWEPPATGSASTAPVLAAGYPPNVLHLLQLAIEKAEFRPAA